MTAAALPANAHEFRLPTHTLRYLTWGNTGNPPIVLVHGGLDNAQTWNDVAVLLARHWHVLALDLRGHGDSDWSSTGDYFAEAYNGDIARFLKEIVGSPVPVVAHSMGARLALQPMGALPEAISMLVAIEGLGAQAPSNDSDLDENMRTWIADREARQEGDEVAKMGDWLRACIVRKRRVALHADLESRIARQLADRKKGLTAAQADAFVRSNMRLSDGKWAWKFDPLARWQASHEQVHSQMNYWEAIEGPVLHIYGSQSWAYPPAQDKLDAFRNGRLAVIGGAGHWVHLNKPVEVATAIEKFHAATMQEA